MTLLYAHELATVMLSVTKGSIKPIQGLCDQTCLAAIYWAYYVIPTTIVLRPVEILPNYENTCAVVVSDNSIHLSLSSPVL